MIKTETGCRAALLTAVLLIVIITHGPPAWAQQATEQTAPLRYNGWLQRPQNNGAQLKTTQLTLPFFEDFTDYSAYPNQSRWQDSAVYINNTMAANAISRGVATFDALNQYGRPYDTLNPGALVFGDSLTSRAIDISSYSPADSVYFSFFYQPQGNGFYPEITDSLMLYFLNKNSSWVRIWSKAGTTLQPFQQVMIPVADTNFLHNNFQLRFVSKASINTSDDIWNIDYLRMAAGRSFTDTAVADVAFTNSPSPLLNDYTSMPYRQYLANVDGETAGQISAGLRNNLSVQQSPSISFKAKDSASGTLLSAVSAGIVTVPGYSSAIVSVPSYNGFIAQTGYYDRVVIDQQFFLQGTTDDASKTNDSISHPQVFDNYLSYDDGTAEKSYFLNQFATLPASVGLEFHLNIPDTLRGFEIYFGQQVPSASGKFFSVAVKKTLAGVNGSNTEETVFEQYFYQPVFSGMVNGFSVYRFDSPVPMPQGTFYITVMQPAQSGSDSLYYGLDVNRTTGNHLYYNVLNVWESSAISGALMIRPLMGLPVTPTGIGFPVEAAANNVRTFSVYPQPAAGGLHFLPSTNDVVYRLTDAAGKTVQHGRVKSNSISLEGLPSGAYFIQLQQNNKWSEAQAVLHQ